MTASDWLPTLWAFAIPAALAWPIGRWMTLSLDRPSRRPGPASWAPYARSMLAFNAASFAVGFGILATQGRLPMNPDRRPGMAGDLAFHSAVSFATNCSQQHYAGERDLSAFAQLGVITWLDFTSAATGLACLLAVARGLRGDRDLGDFYVDLRRSLVRVLVPACLVVAALLAATGVPMTFAGVARAATPGGPGQSIARGPVAALVAAKQLLTVGGGFFGPNSAHPLENPTPWSNLVQVVSITLLPMASVLMFGRMIRDRRHGLVLFGVMLAPALGGAALLVPVELGANDATIGARVVAGPNLEGKELRVGPAATATWAAVTSATSNGSVDGMLGSHRAMGVLVPMALMMANVAFSGVGAGVLHLMLFVVVAVFLAGLMVGRTPEYLGKKVEAREVKLAMIGLLIHPLVVCGGAALFAAVPAWGASTVGNPGPRGFSEILYEFASAAATNGSGLEGLGDNTPAWNVSTGVVMLLGRYPALIVPLAIAGAMAGRSRVPSTVGTLRTDTATFAGLLLAVVALIGALSFLPSAALGPIADQLTPAPWGAATDDPAKP